MFVYFFHPMCGHPRCGARQQLVSTCAAPGRVVLVQHEVTPGGDRQVGATAWDGKTSRREVVEKNIKRRRKVVVV